MTTGGIILAGGGSGRMGTDKALLTWRGVRAVDHMFAMAQAVCDGPVLISGPDYQLPFVPDPAAFAGPVGGIVAGARALEDKGCSRALVLSVDAPALLEEDLLPLLEAISGAAYEGLPLPMTISLRALPLDAEPGWPIRRLAERAGVVSLGCPPGVQRRARGANSPAEWTSLLAEFSQT